MTRAQRKRTDLLRPSRRKGATFRRVKAPNMGQSAGGLRANEILITWSARWRRIGCRGASAEVVTFATGGWLGGVFGWSYRQSACDDALPPAGGRWRCKF